MLIDPESGNYVGLGESSTYIILKRLTGLPARDRREFPKNGIYKQIPLEKVIHRHDFNLLSKEHKQGSIDIFLVLNQTKIAVRVQGKGHGQGEKHHGRFSLKGPGKSKYDQVQANLIKKYNSLVDIIPRECPNIFKERTNEEAKYEVIGSFKTFNVMIPVDKELT